MSRKPQHISLPIFLVVLYFLIIHWSMGLRPEHLLLAGFVLGCYFLHPKSREFMLDFLPLVFFGILYDFLRIYPKAWAGPIHVTWPYELERFLFGIPTDAGRIIPCAFFQTHNTAIADLIAGFVYSLHMIVPTAFAFYVWLKNREFVRRFNWIFFIVNILAFATYVALPVAPPWYVLKYGFEPGDWSVLPEAAGLVRFDALLNTSYYHGVYSKSAWVFGAIPSMHAGFPFLVVWHARKVFTPKGWIPLAILTVTIWFAAVYLAHHYVIDLIAGVLYVFIALWIHSLVCPKKKASSHASSA